MWYLPGWLETPCADAVLEELRTTLVWQAHALRLFGRTVLAPRRCAWHGDAGARYAYSGLALEPAPWTPTLAALRDALHGTVGARFDSVLANLYRDGHDRMGWHADDEAALGPAPVIASVSLGATRRFVLRHRTRRELPVSALALEHGSLLVMAGATQRCWKHALPAAARVVQSRINLTFRTVRATPGSQASVRS